ncbi:MAG: hypothetical protein R3Y16_06190 [Rikenellaceae bacterium]
MSNRIPPHKRTVPTVAIFILLSLSYFLKVGAVESLLPWARLPWADAIPLVKLPSASMTQLGGWIQSFESVRPVWSALIAYLLIILGATATMRLTILHNLYDKASYTPLVIYLAVFASLASPHEILAPAIVGLVMVVSLYELYAGYSRHENTHNIFSGCFWIGLIALIYPSAVILWPIIFVVIILFDRIGRELPVALAALVTPFLLLFYCGWLFSETSFAEQFWSWRVAFAYPHRAFAYLFSGGFTSAYLVRLILSILICAGLSILSVVNIERISIALMSRTRIVYAMLLSIVVLFIAAAPSFTFASLLMATPALAITLSAALFEIEERWSMWTYLVFILISMI